MSNVDAQLFCACGVSYNITTSTTSGSDLPQDVYYQNVGFQSVPQVIQGQTFPETAACIIGEFLPTESQDSAVIIAFRGTEYTSISDWATDLMVEPFTPQGFPSGCLIHTGFYYSTSELIPQIQNAISALNLTSNTQIYITGHSKGGAMASLAAYMLCLNNTISMGNLHVTTFASPFPGNEYFAETYRGGHIFDKKIQQNNYANYLDAVPLMPLSAKMSEIICDLVKSTLVNALLADFKQWGYASCATTIQYIKEDGSINSYDSDHFFSLDGPHDLHEIYDHITHKPNSEYLMVVNAHNHSYGYGYWNAICPSIPIPDQTLNPQSNS